MLDRRSAAKHSGAANIAMADKAFILVALIMVSYSFFRVIY